MLGFGSELKFFRLKSLQPNKAPYGFLRFSHWWSHALGREVALYFASQGWHVVVHYNRSQALAMQLQAEMNDFYPNIKVKLEKAELSSEEEVSGLFNRLAGDRHPSSVHCQQCLFSFEPDSGLDFTSNLALEEQLKVNLLAPMKFGQCLANCHSKYPEKQPIPLSAASQHHSCSEIKKSTT
jgi:hypothetical protein